MNKKSTVILYKNTHNYTIFKLVLLEYEGETMNITIKDERDNSTATITTTASTVKQLLEEQKINPETVLVTKNNEVLTSDEAINDNDTFELLSIISGG